MRREAFKFWDLVCLILETLRYICHQFSTTNCQLLLSSQYRFCHQGHWIMLKIAWSCVQIIGEALEKATCPLWICLKSKLSPTKDCLDLIYILEMWTNLPAMIPWRRDPYLGPIRTNDIIDMCTKSSNEMQICLILTADNTVRSRFYICKFCGLSCDTIRRGFCCIMNGKIYFNVLIWNICFEINLGIWYEFVLCGKI